MKLGKIILERILSAQFQLVSHQIKIGIPASYQFFMRTDLDNPPFIKYDNLISIANRTKTMSNDYYCFTPIEAIQILYNSPLIIGIKRIGRLIEIEKSGILINRSSNQDPLPLPLADPLPIGANHRVIT